MWCGGDMISQSAPEGKYQELWLSFVAEDTFFFPHYLCEQLKDTWININPADVGARRPL